MRRRCVIGVLASVKAKELKKACTLLYLAGADLARDLAGELGERGFSVVTHTTYRMNPVPSLPREVADAFTAGGIRRCCIIRGAVRGHSWKRRGLPALKSRPWRSRNAASPTPWRPSSGRRVPRRSWSLRRRMKMPCSRRWTVRCGRDRATRRLRVHACPGFGSGSARTPARVRKTRRGSLHGPEA